MGPKVDLRPQSQKAKIGWCPAWTGVTDTQGDKVGDWALQLDFESFKCKWCGTVRRLLVTKYN